MSAITPGLVRKTASFRFTTIGAICDEFGGDVQTGPFGSQLHASDYSEEGIPVVMPQDMVNGRIVCDRIARVSEKHVLALSRHKLHSSDLVFSRRGDVSRFALVTTNEAGWLCGTGSIRIRMNSPEVLPEYAMRYLQQPHIGKWLLNEAKGITMPNLNTGIIRALPFIVPPVQEQRRIAAILDQAETLRTQRRTALALLDSLTQSLFLDMFGNPMANDRGWPKATVSDFVAGFESGKSLVADDEEDSGSEYRVLKVSAVTSLEYKPEQSKAVPADYKPPKSHIVRPGDLLFSRANTSELIGATAYVESTPENILLPDKLWRFVWHDPAVAAPLYVMHLFRQPKFRQEIGQRASGTSGSMKNISQEKVLSIQTGNPPLSLQQTFATRIQSIEALKATHRRALAALNELFASLQQRAFSGEFVPSSVAVHRAAANKPVHNVEDLRRLEASLGLEALIYVTKRTTGNNLYTALKTLYVADKYHLENHGRLIYGESYNALPKGPVPDAAYDTVKFLRGDQMFCALGESAARAALKLEGNQRLVPLRDADLTKLGTEAVQSLEAAIRYFANSSFGQVMTATHDTAYERTPKNQAIPMQYLIDMLSVEARQRHWNL